MLLPQFTLHRPTAIDDAIALLAGHGDDAVVYSGGTELLLLMKLGMSTPDHLVDVKRISELAGLEVRGGRLDIGALTTHRRLERDPLVREVLPALAELSAAVANVRVRNMGTLGGNLCFAEPHSDPATLLMALDAEVELAGAGGRRRMPLASFIRGPLDTDLANGELMTKVVVPLPETDARVRYQRIALRERPTVNVAVVSSPRRVSVAIGAAGGRPVRAEGAERILTADRDAVSSAADAAAEDCGAYDDNEASAEYKRHLVRVLLRRALSR